MTTKLEKIDRISKSTEQLAEQYGKVKLWGSCPDGDVKYQSIMAWLSNEDNMALMEQMIETAKEIQSL